MRGVGSSPRRDAEDHVVSAREAMDARCSPRGDDGEVGDSCCDSPESRCREGEEEDAGIVRARFSPSRMRRRLQGDDEEGGPIADGRYLQSLRKGRHPLRCTDSVSFDGSEDNDLASSRVTCSQDDMMRRHRSRSDGSILGSSSSSDSDGNINEDKDNGDTDPCCPTQPQHLQPRAGGGLFESAKNWIQSQREKLARLELERQVEDQRQILVEEGRRRRMQEAERRRKEEDAIRCFAVKRAESVSSVASDGNHLEQACSDSSLCQQQQQQQSQQDEMKTNSNNNYHSTTLAIQSITSLCGITTLDDGDDDEYTDMTHIDSSGQQLLNMVCSTDQDYYFHVCSDHDYLKVGTPRNTVSGMGMSVKVDFPPDDHRHHENRTDPRRNHDSPERHSPHDNSDRNHVKIVREPPTLIPPILSAAQMESLVRSSALPPSLDHCKWERIYSLSRDGDSFDTFLRNVEGRDRTVLVVRTTLDDIFGGYADARWEGRGMYHLGNEFYGTGQAFLFRFVEEEEERWRRVVVYKWSGINRYIQLCDAGRRIIAFGGGGDEGVFGLCIEDDFRRGTTGQCETFQNEPLCEEGYFDVLDLEVWGFALDF